MGYIYILLTIIIKRFFLDVFISLVFFLSNLCLHNTFLVVVIVTFSFDRVVVVFVVVVVDLFASRRESTTTSTTTTRQIKVEREERHGGASKEFSFPKSSLVEDPIRFRISLIPSSSDSALRLVF